MNSIHELVYDYLKQQDGPITSKQILENAVPKYLNKKELSIVLQELEDENRIVKEKFNKWVNPCTCPKEFPVCVCGNKPLGKLVFKSKAPTEAELEENPRARSSRLRCFEKY